jgi:hypothetical protein
MDQNTAHLEIRTFGEDAGDISERKWSSSEIESCDIFPLYSSFHVMQQVSGP